MSHQRRLTTSTNLTTELYNCACELFEELWNGAPVRHLGIHTSRVQDGDFNRQLTLFDTKDYEKLAKMDFAVDNLRERFGIDCIQRAIFLNQPIDHMSGGISREKRSVDYDKLEPLHTHNM
jgi:DNA polymerase-4